MDSTIKTKGFIQQNLFIIQDLVFVLFVLRVYIITFIIVHWVSLCLEFMFSFHIAQNLLINFAMFASTSVLYEVKLFVRLVLEFFLRYKRSIISHNETNLSMTFLEY